MSESRLTVECYHCHGTRMVHTAEVDGRLATCPKCGGTGELYDADAEDTMLVVMAEAKSGIALTNGERAVLLYYDIDHKRAKIRHFAEHKWIPKSDIKGVKYE